MSKEISRKEVREEVRVGKRDRFFYVRIVRKVFKYKFVLRSFRFFFVREIFIRNYRFEGVGVLNGVCVFIFRKVFRYWRYSLVGEGFCCEVLSLNF